jgi:aspartyl-tRNA(Asn)/glutamyl-tRNA(Gln) amidotransferase subunit A
MDGLRFGGGEVGEISDYQELFSKNRGKFFGPEVKRRIMLGSYVLSHGYYDAFYGKAKILQARMKKSFDEIFKEASFIALPTAPTTAFKSGEIKDPLTLYLEDIFTVPANLLGVPAISVPTGLDTNNMPMSIQIMAPISQEESIFNLVSKINK